jgi:hypothetical protein
LKGTVVTNVGIQFSFFEIKSVLPEGQLMCSKLLYFIVAEIFYIYFETASLRMPTKSVDFTESL